MFQSVQYEIRVNEEKNHPLIGKPQLDYYFLFIVFLILFIFIWRE